jgi:hypothetical protein
MPSLANTASKAAVNFRSWMRWGEVVGAPESAVGSTSSSQALVPGEQSAWGDDQVAAEGRG